LENLTGKTVAVIKDYLVHKELAENYPDISLVFCKNNKDALKAVSSGKAFAFIGGLLSTPLMINEYGLTNLKAAAPSKLQDATVAMAIRNDWPELRDIINKVLDAMPVDEKAAILNKWSSVRIEYGIRLADIFKWLLVVASGASSIVLLFVFLNRSLAKKVRERTVELESSSKSLAVEIVERKQKEQQLQEYQERLKDLASQLTIAEEKERRRIAADLHDHIGHSLVLARMQLNGILDTKSALEQKILTKDISNILLETLQDTRNLIFELSSPTMNELGLSAAISEWLVEQIAKRQGLETEFIDNIRDEHRKTLDENTRALVFRNVRELLSNVVKHARAKKVRVHLTQEANRVKIVVEDDGVGFDFDAAKTKTGPKAGFGLFSIQERMADLGGAFDIQSEPGKGCKVILTVPVEERKEME
jgi:signal transduction histidine kinase